MTGGTAVVVLAAGRGVRMKSALPKVLHAAGGRPLLDRVLETAVAVLARERAGHLVVVAGSGREDVAAHVRRAAPSAAVVLQHPPRGTGDAVRKAVKHFGNASRVVVLSGDVPMLGVRTVRALLSRLGGRDRPAIVFLTAILDDPRSYGRVVRSRGAVTKIVEEKDATPAEREIRETNGGVYAFDRPFLQSTLPKLKAVNAQGEYYLTDLLGLALAAGRRVVGIPARDPDEVLGVNSRGDLARVDALLRRRATRAAMAAGATLVRPETITLDETAVLGKDSVVGPFATLLGTTRIGEGTHIGQGCVVKDSILGRRVVVKPYCVIESARVGDRAILGPFARLREGTVLAGDVHIGNFVETKKAVLAKGVKANHLTYLGDTTIGERTNVGAGVITCNYDGFTKHPTTIGKDVFVGSDTQLVAPVTVGDGAIVAAGTTVTSDVPAGDLVLSRSPQTNVPQGGVRYRERKKKRPGKR